MMSSNKSKLRLMGAFAALATLALAVSCRGFFVGDTLQSIAVGPASVNVPIGSSQQMSAVGTYTPSGDTKDITGASGIVWMSSDDTATVNATGLVTGVSIGTPSITATLGTVSGQASINIVLSNVTSIVITPSSQNISADGGTAMFQALANVSGQSQQVDISAQAVWSIGPNSANYSLTQNVTPETVTTTAATIGEVDTLTATYTVGTTQYSATAKVTVTQ